MNALAVLVLLFSVVFLAAPGTSRAAADWNVGISGSDKGIDGFHLSVGEYYDVPEREVVVVHERGIDDDELPVVFFLARRAHVPPEAIVDLRIRGLSWMDITLHYGLAPDIYYVPVTVVERHRHHPYGPAWGYYKKYPRCEDWRRIRLRDADIVNQVNLRFISEHYHYAPERVMSYRDKGRLYRAIDREVWNKKHGREKHVYYADRDWRHNQRGGGERRVHASPDRRRGGDRDGNREWKERGHGGRGRD